MEKIDLGLCQECGAAPAACVMYRILATDEERSNGPTERVKCMCLDCAWTAFELGEWERDE